MKLRFMGSLALSLTASVGLAEPERQPNRGAAPRPSFGAFPVTNGLTGQPIPQGNPTPRLSVVAYDNLTRPGAADNLNLAYVDPANYSNGQPIPMPLGEGVAFMSPMGSDPNGLWAALGWPGPAAPCHVLSDDYTADEAIWTASPFRKLASFEIVIAVDNRGRPVAETRRLDVAFLSDHVTDPSQPATLYGLIQIDIAAPADSRPGYLLSVDTSAAEPAINIPRTGFVVLAFEQRDPNGDPFGGVNLNAGAAYIAGGDLLDANLPPPLTQVGVSRDAGLVGEGPPGWLLADPADNAIPPLPAANDYAAIFTRSNAWDVAYVDDEVQPRSELAHSFPLRLRIVFAGCAGDADGDGDVDQDDLDLLLFNYATTQPVGTNGDIDGDGDVDQDDLDFVLFNFGCN